MVLKQPVVMNLWSKFWKVYEELFNVTFMYIFGTHYTCFVSSLRMLWLVWTQISNANWTLSHLDVHVSASDQFVKHQLFLYYLFGKLMTRFHKTKLTIKTSNSESNDWKGSKREDCLQLSSVPVSLK